MATLDHGVLEFLMEGDPSIRWQVMADLLDSSPLEIQAERVRTLKEGWGKQFLDAQLSDGSWPVGRSTGSVWTLVTMVDLGMPAVGNFAARGFEDVVQRLMPHGKVPNRDILTTRMDLCHLGFWLKIGAHFLSNDDRLLPLAEIVLSLQFADGGWNCRCRTKPKTKHSSFHTTFNVLEGLREMHNAGVLPSLIFSRAESRAIEFMLQHQMYRSDKTGEIINERFLELTYPTYWHYNVLRGLDYIRSTPFIKDPRLSDALLWLERRRKPNGCWPVEKRIPGVNLFPMERMGRDSRWNTLKALRIIKAAS